MSIYLILLEGQPGDPHDLMAFAFLKSIYTTHRTRRSQMKILKIIYIIIKVEDTGSIMESKLC